MLLLHRSIGIILFSLFALQASATTIPDCVSGTVENNVEDGVDITGTECGILNTNIGTVTGNITLTGTGALVINGDITKITGNIEICNTCVLTINGSIGDIDGNVEVNGILNLTGSIKADGNLEIKGVGNATLDGGFFESTGGNVEIDTATSLNLQNASSIIANGNIQNEGTITSDGTGNSMTGTYTGGGTVPPELNCGQPTCTHTSALPINLVYFNGICENGQILFNWITASEINNDFFSIQSSHNGNDWNTIAEVKGNGTSTILNEYKMNTTANRSSKYYRLMQTDYDGNFEIFETIYVGCGGMKIEPQVYPNPGTAFELLIQEVDNYEIRVFDTKGSLILTEKFEGGGTYNLDFDAPSGFYYLIVNTPEHSFDPIRILKN